MKDFYPPEEALLLETIDHLSAQLDQGSTGRVSYADYRHSCLLLEMIEEMEQELDELRAN